MTSKGMRAIAFAYKDYSSYDFDNLAISDFHSDQARREFENATTFVGMVALKDPLRPRVKQIIQYAGKGGINIRLISGDNLDTAKAAAVDAGILTPEEYNTEASLETQRKYCMDAKDFRAEVGPLETD